VIIKAIIIIGGLAVWWHQKPKPKPGGYTKKILERKKEYSQGFYFSPRAGGEVRIFGFFHNKQTKNQTNKQINKQTNKVVFLMSREG